MMPDKAVTAPRFSTGHEEDSFNPDPDRTKTYVKLGSLSLNQGIGETVQSELAARGHEIDINKRTIASPIMIYLDPETRMMYAAGDPKAGRHAAALK